MNILLTGATGFIGSNLAQALTNAGHTVVAAQRRAPSNTAAGRYVVADFSQDHASETWETRLVDIDAVINAVGIIQERGAQSFDAVHTLAPQALFAACARRGVARVVQISALGAQSAATAYFASKHRADEYLASLPLDWTICYPSLVYGDEGASSKLFRMLASLPVIPVLGDGAQRVQPIHIDDLVAAIAAALTDPATVRRRLALVGPRPCTMREYLATLRSSLRLRRTFFLPIPTPLVRLAAATGSALQVGLLDRDTLAMLDAGNTADPATTTRLLGRPPRPPRQFVPPRYADAVRTVARLSWLLPVLRYSIAIVWLWSGITSFGLYPREHSYALLDATGLSPAWHRITLLSGALLDVALGIATLVVARHRLLWLMQCAVILTYTSIISFAMPELWLHPFGPVLKNLPMLAGIALLYFLEPVAPVESKAA